MIAVLAVLSAVAGPVAAAPKSVTPIRLVVIDEKTTRAFGPLPWPRDRHAQLVRMLDRAGARTIVLRFYYRDARQDRGDAALVAATAKAGRVFVEMGRADAPGGWAPAADWLAGQALKVGGSPPRRLFTSKALQVPFEALARAVKGVGAIDVVVNKDHKLEGLPLVVGYQGRVFPSLALRVFLHATGREREPLVFSGERALAFGFWPTTVTKGLKIGPTRLSMDQYGCTLVNLTAPGRGYPTLSFVDVLKGGVKPTVFRDAIVFVGAAAAELDVETSTGPKSGLELVADQLSALFTYTAGN